MADVNTPNGGNAGDDVTFEADPALEAETGAADVEFEPDESGTSGGFGQQIKDQAMKFGSQAAEQARTFAGQGKDRATDALDEVSRLLQDAAGEVDQRLGADYGKYARTAAEGVSNFAETLRSREVDDLIEDATAFVRKSPAIAIGTAAAVGFVLARLIKSGVDAAADLNERAAPAETPAND